MILPHEITPSLSESAPIQAALSTAAFSPGVSERLASLTLAVEGDLMWKALDFFMASRTEDTDGVHEALAGAAAIDAAWCDLLSEFGVSRPAIADAGPPRHVAVKNVLQLTDGDVDPARVEYIKGEMMGLLMNEG